MHGQPMSSPLSLRDSRKLRCAIRTRINRRLLTRRCPIPQRSLLMRANHAIDIQSELNGTKIMHPHLRKRSRNSEEDSEALETAVGRIAGETRHMLARALARTTP